MMKQVLLLFGIISQVFANGTVNIHLKEYRNPTGTGSNGHCCDGKWSLCQSNGCDYKFTICIDTVESDNSTDSCAYALYNPDHLDDQDNVVFGDVIGGMANPIPVLFKGIVPSFSMKIIVVDQDGWGQSDDDVDFLRFNFHPGQTSLSTTIQSRTSLEIEVTVDCDTDFYGPYCTECHNTDRYICLDTGEISCLPGWVGSNCDMKLTTEPMTTTKESKEIGFDCYDLKQRWGYNTDDAYEIRPTPFTYVIAFCYLKSSPGWTVIQRNINDETNFNKDWNTYKYGFGHARDDHNYWMGLEHMHQFTTRRNYTLKIKLYLEGGSERYASYGSFRIGSEDTGYKLHVDDYSGDAGDALTKSTHFINSHNGMAFTTKDRDNDEYRNNCATLYRSGWWYNDCYFANLNGKYPDASCRRYDCIAWNTITPYDGNRLIGSEMMILPQEE